jgi:putative membrane protein
MLGFALPLAAAIAHAASLVDMVLWAAVALLVQLGAFAALHLLRRDVSAALERGDMAEAIVWAAGSVVLGLLNAACMTP